ncbi:hypothetical protein Tco_1347392 [Tanacetum coccineum]
MMEGIDGEFHFIPEGGVGDEGSSPSTRSVNNEALTIDAEPLTVTAESSEREPRQKVRKVPPQVRKVSGDASDPLDVDSDHDIHVVPADSSSNVPADYVSAGHVLVPADRDRIC